MDNLALQERSYRRRSQPPWLDNVNVTSDLVYKYQMTGKTIDDVLKADLNYLKTVHQVLFEFSFVFQLCTMELKIICNKCSFLLHRPLLLMINWINYI